MKQKLIIIEGLDGCGKTTQTELIKKVFPDFRYITFPNYDSPSGEIIKSYLDGNYKETDNAVSAYTASCFYAVDRYTGYKTDWEQDIRENRTVISSRYVSSNAIYQMTKLSEENWDEYLNWLYDLEYNKFGIPRPFATLFLDMPVDISRQFLLNRYEGDEKRLDIHENDLRFMESCRKTAGYVAKKEGWIMIPCSENGKPLSIESIHNTIITKIKELLKQLK